MQIFLSHSSNFDYQNELYLPIKTKFSEIIDLFVFPEELKTNTKEIIRSSDLFFCEISHKSVGSAIETGWADAFNKPIYCFYKYGSSPSSSFRYLTNKIYEYKSIEDLLEIMESIIKNQSINI